MQAAPGTRVTLHFTLALADGTEIDATGDAEPMTVVLGQGMLLESLESRLVGLSAGDKRRFDIPAHETHFAEDEDTIQTLPRSEFPEDADLQVGNVFGFQLPNGEEVPGMIVSFDEREVVVDFSHPLAGHDVVFEVEILAVEPVS